MVWLHPIIRGSEHKLIWVSRNSFTFAVAAVTSSHDTQEGIGSGVMRLVCEHSGKRPHG